MISFPPNWLAKQTLETVYVIKFVHGSFSRMKNLAKTLTGNYVIKPSVGGALTLPTKWGLSESDCALWHHSFKE